MKKLLLLLLVFAGFIACENEVIAPEITEIEADQEISISARTGGVSVCHKNAGEIVIGEAAVETHIAHGDAVDRDGDGFFDAENPCSETDCDDTNADVNPAMEEICDDGIDNDCDGLIDLDDPDCNDAYVCMECDDDIDCSSIPNAVCIELDGSKYCVIECVDGGECPPGYSCVDIGTGTTYCIPDTDSCTCTGDNSNETRVCETVLPDGRICYGEQTCTASGWSPCILPDEICGDGVDNNCNGEVDEGCDPAPQIGDFYEGGVVFYILQLGDEGYIEGEVHGLICSVENYFNLPYTHLMYFNHLTYTQIGFGAWNTDRIVEIMTNATSSDLNEYAAGITRLYNGGGFTDWFLPSFDELKALYESRNAINTTSVANGGENLWPDYYWSSSQTNIEGNPDYSLAWAVDMGLGSTTFLSKIFGRALVRPIRAF